MARRVRGRVLRLLDTRPVTPLLDALPSRDSRAGRRQFAADSAPSRRAARRHRVCSFRARCSELRCDLLPDSRCLPPLDACRRGPARWPGRARTGSAVLRTARPVSQFGRGWDGRGVGRRSSGQRGPSVSSAIAPDGVPAARTRRTGWSCGAESTDVACARLGAPTARMTHGSGSAERSPGGGVRAAGSGRGFQAGVPGAERDRAGRQAPQPPVARTSATG